MMKKSIVLAAVVSLSTLVQATNIKIATYNIRRAGLEKDVKNLWESRKPMVFDLINSIAPDVIGFQEVVKNQFDDLRTVLAHYGSFGEPRNMFASGWLQNSVVKHPSAKDEHNPIFYNKERLELLEYGTFGINPTSTYLPRACTWGKFRDKQTGQLFYVYNTHLSNTEKGIKGWFVTSAGKTRREQIKMIMHDVTRRTQGLPVIFMGDLNTNLRGKYKLRILADAGFVYARSIAEKVVGSVKTRTGWNNSELKSIDHIFIKSPQKSSVALYEVVESPKGVFPSDHRPVVVDVSWK